MRMVRVLLLARLTPQSGNLTTAERIRSHLVESGNTCDLQNTDFFETVQGFQESLKVVGNKFDCVIGIHLWRAGKLLLAVLTCPSQNFTEKNMLIDKMKECATIKKLFHSRNIVNGSLIIFLLVAGLRPVKDPMYLFQVFSDWHKEDSRVFLVVVGPEIDLAFSKNVKDSAKKYPGVVVMPALSQEDLHSAIKHCAIAVLNTSISEGMASSILEAMDLDTVVLARKIPGNECLIKHDENGLLFETPEEFLSLAKQVAYDEKYRERITRGGREYVSNNHSLSLEKETYHSVVRTLME